MTQYRVLVDDNFHYMEEDERRELGTFGSAEEAVAACRKIVDGWLAENFKPGMTASELYESYVSFGEDPFVVAPPGAERVSFSAWEYAMERTQAVCSDRQAE